MPLIFTISSSENSLLPSTRMDSTGKGFEGSTTTCCLLTAGAGFLRTGGTAETSAAANRSIPTVRRTGTLIGRLSRPQELQILLIMTTAREDTMKLFRLLLAAGLAAVPALAQRHTLAQFNPQTEEGKVLQAISTEQDGNRKLALLEEFVSKYPKHEATSWVLYQMQ